MVGKCRVEKLRMTPSALLQRTLVRVRGNRRGPGGRRRCYDKRPMRSAAVAVPILVSVPVTVILTSFVTFTAITLAADASPVSKTSGVVRPSL